MSHWWVPDVDAQTAAVGGVLVAAFLAMVWLILRGGTGQLTPRHDRHGYFEGALVDVTPSTLTDGFNQTAGFASRTVGRHRLPRRRRWRQRLAKPALATMGDELCRASQLRHEQYWAESPLYMRTAEALGVSQLPGFAA
ncbi:hypothetical protein [Mycobacterium sp. SMC-11]|uniref:hypothetical protein n=1 Tax=Mycobacterium sp. SMC-11 TaxID=3385969 RepID=UPI00390C4C51